MMNRPISTQMNRFVRRRRRRRRIRRRRRRRRRFDELSVNCAGQLLISQPG